MNIKLTPQMSSFSKEDKAYVHVADHPKRKSPRRLLRRGKTHGVPVWKGKERGRTTPTKTKRQALSPLPTVHSKSVERSKPIAPKTLGKGMILCPACGGNGYIDRMVTHREHVSRYVCPTCKGKGQVPRGTKPILPSENHEYHLL